MHDKLTVTYDKRKRRSTLMKELRVLQDPGTDDECINASFSRLHNDNGNRIIHWDSLKSLVCTNVKCKHCDGEVTLTECTTGIATVVNLTCNNCKIKHNNNSKKTDYEKLGFRKNSVESFAINCQLVLALMQTGCGAAEAATLLTFLDMPHSSTFQKCSFRRIQLAIRSSIKKITNEAMEKAREDEIRCTLGEEKLVAYKNKLLTPEEVPLTVSYDMGWNKRSSGNKYDSISGHGFIMGGNTKKILNHRCLSKCCSLCDTKNLRNNKEPPPHECPKNHQGSSKSMKCEAIFQMVKESFYDHRFTISTIISDDDSTMKSNLKHSYSKLIEAGKMTRSEWPKTKQKLREK